MWCDWFSSFSAQELKGMDAKQVALIRDAVTNEIQTSPDIRKLLTARARAAYDELKAFTKAEPEKPGPA